MSVRGVLCLVTAATFVLASCVDRPRKSGGEDARTQAGDSAQAFPEPFAVRFQESRFYRAHDMFLSADNPAVVAAGRASLADDEEVLGFVIGGKPRAYSIWALSYHHVVNDRIGGTPLAATY